MLTDRVRRRWFRGAAAAGLLLILAGCGGGPTADRPTPAATARPTPTPVPACASDQAETTAAGVTSDQPVLVLAQGLNEPDDLLVYQDQIYVGEYGSGRIVDLQGLAGSSSPNLLPVTIPEVEGIAMLGGSMYVSGQEQDAVLRIQGQSVHTVYQLQPVTGIEGVDAIFSDGATLVVPDSPHGDVLFVNAAGQLLRSVSGFDRPTGGWALPDGSILIPDENAGQVVRLPASLSGRTVLASGLGEADDVAAAGTGGIFAISIDQGRLVSIAGGNATSVATGLGQPQGLGVDGAGNPVVTEYTRGRVDVVVTTFKLLPPAGGPVTLAPDQPLCVDLLRAPGYSTSVQIAAGSGYRVLHQPGTSGPGSIEPTGCTQGCRVEVKVTSGSLEDTVWLGYDRSG